MEKKSMFIFFVLVVFLFFAICFSSSATAGPKNKAILLGLPLDMNDYLGVDSKEGAALAIKEINAAGGVNVGGEMRPFDMVIAETRDVQPGVPITEALLAVERLITQKKVDFLVGGPIRSEACFAARSLITQSKILSIATVGCYSPRFGDAKKYPYSFRIQGDVAFEIPNVQMGLLKHVRDKFGINKIYIVVQDVKHSRAAGGLIEKLAKRDGFEIVGHDSYPTGSTDYSMALLQAKNKGAQMLYLWMDHPEAAILGKQWHEMKIPALPIGFPSAATKSEWWNATEGRGEYFVADLLWAGRSASEATPMTMKFFNAFVKEYGREPDGQGHPETYMGVYLLKEAIESAGTLETEAVAKAMKDIDLVGVYGRMRFNENNEIIFDPGLDPKKGCVGAVIQWQKGKRVTVFPTTIATGEIQLPPWMK
jgi:branched-chain amino acid transport system substrate-binding protein